MTRDGWRKVVEKAITDAQSMALLTQRLEDQGPGHIGRIVMTHCPECGAELEFDEVDVGVGTIRGNPGCPECHWTPTTPNDEDLIVTASCPVCGAEQVDLDGFGVVNCAKCGYCTHVSMSCDICNLCGRNVPVVEGRKPVEYRDASTGCLVYWSATGPGQRKPREFAGTPLFDDMEGAD